MNNLNQYGPIQYPGRTVWINSEGIQTRDDPNFPVLPSPEQWMANWIWLDPVAYPHHQDARYTFFCAIADKNPGMGVFRKTFYWDMKPEKVYAWVSGDTKYRLFVNGNMVGRGPAEVGGDYDNRQSPDWWFYDSYDLTPFFHAGVNVIVAEVILGPVMQADYSTGHGGFLFQADIHLDNQTRIQLISDNTWKGMLNLAYPGPNHYDARHAPYDLHAADFDDHTWHTAKILSTATQGAWKILPRQIPPLAEARVFPSNIILPFPEFQKRVFNLESVGNNNPPFTGECVTILPGSPLTLWFEFERELTGHPQFCVEGEKGTTLQLGIEEIAGRDDRIETYILRDGLQQYECIELHGFQYIRLTVTFPGGGACQTPLKIHAFTAAFTSFPVQYQGQFACSDPLFNTLWQTIRWTTQMCMQSYHLDSPIHQEGLGCTGDYMIEALISQAAFGETRLARLDLLRTACLLRQKNGHMYHTSYSLLLLQMLVDYWDHTGDEEIVRAVLPDIFGVLALFHSYVGSDGLVTEAPNYMFLDWLQVDGYDMHHPPCVLGQAYMSAFYYKALCNAIRLCQVTGAQVEAKVFAERAESLRQAFVRELWVPEKGLFCDGIPFRTHQEHNYLLPEDKDRIYFSKHTNALAVAYHLAPADWHASIIHQMMNDDTLPIVQPYFMHFVFEALHQSGLFAEYGFGEMHKWKALLDEHPTSLKECWDNGDYSHAWGGTPAYQFFARVLGITPATPGFQSVNLQPNLGDLDWAEGQLPTPHGSIHCQWERKDGRMAGKISIPADVTAYLLIPASETNHTGIILNGKLFSEAQCLENDILKIQLPGGEIQVVWSEK